jgi:K+-sensing histidine kinase KdpD
MLQEAHTLLKNRVDVIIGYIETHGRKETDTLLEGLPLIPRCKLFYKGKEFKAERFMACISSNHEIARMVIRKTARLDSYYHSDWYVLYVQTARKRGDKIGLAAHRHLINNFKLATEILS